MNTCMTSSLMIMIRRYHEWLAGPMVTLPRGVNEKDLSGTTLGNGEDAVAETIVVFSPGSMEGNSAQVNASSVVASNVELLDRGTQNYSGR